MRNLPGLYELFLFPRMKRSDTGTRFVVTTVSKYLIFLFAYSAALLTLHFSFSSLGWLFAAASVGIGFGLQEIISNFVSGLILFFERPIRVGDVVTVGENTGTVKSITIRATHVENFDRQITIMPNRRFIVDDVINWSHNDMLIRRRVQVGVAYGTDVVRVSKILEEIVSKHPLVKKHPPPKILFSTFGSSSLDLDILVFIDLKDRFVAESQINTEIARRFAEEGIEIPFPQRDLHLRSVQDAAVITALGAKADAEAAGTETAEPEASESKEAEESTGTAGNGE
jgi:potassium efflux system protein